MINDINACWLELNKRLLKRSCADVNNNIPGKILPRLIIPDYNNCVQQIDKTTIVCEIVKYLFVIWF